MDWPKMYGAVCPVVVDYNYVTKFGSRKVNAKFAKLVARCVICDAKHSYTIEKNPFEEQVVEGLVKYEAIHDMIVDVETEGRFFLVDGKPNIGYPVHLKERARGLYLKGRERELLGKLLKEIER